MNPLFCFVSTDWQSNGNHLVVRILDRGPHFEYPWCYAIISYTVWSFDTYSGVTNGMKGLHLWSLGPKSIKTEVHFV